MQNTLSGWPVPCIPSATRLVTMISVQQLPAAVTYERPPVKFENLERCTRARCTCSQVCWGLLLMIIAGMPPVLQPHARSASLLYRQAGWHATFVESDTVRLHMPNLDRLKAEK